jgi:hypothetical protein
LAKRTQRILLGSSPRKRGPITTVFGYGSRLSARSRASAGTTIFRKNERPTCSCGKRPPVRLACFRPVLYRERCNSNVSSRQLFDTVREIVARIERSEIRAEGSRISLRSMRATKLLLRVPDAMQRERQRSHKRVGARLRRAMASLIRDRRRLQRSTQVGFTRLAHLQAPISDKPEIGVCSAPLRCSRAALRPGHGSCRDALLRRVKNQPSRVVGSAPLFPACYLQ